VIASWQGEAFPSANSSGRPSTHGFVSCGNVL
jgi:hypothetical protein